VNKAGSDTAAGGREIARAQDQLFRTRGSARAKYSALVVGRPGLGALLKYELLVQLSQAVPGALGLFLRKTLYRHLLGSCGRNVVFGHNVVLRHPHKIHIADDVVVDDQCLLDAKGDANAGIRIGSGVFIGRNSILSCKNGDIDVGTAPTSASTARCSRRAACGSAATRCWRPTPTWSAAIMRRKIDRGRSSSSGGSRWASTSAPAPGSAPA
jgi:hypothetical protein